MLQRPRGDVGGHDDLSSDRLTSMLLQKNHWKKLTLPKFFKDFHTNIFLQIHVQKHFFVADFGEPKMTSSTIDEWSLS